MKIKKIIPGIVVQIFDDHTGEFSSQWFEATNTTFEADGAMYVNEKGVAVDPTRFEVRLGFGPSFPINLIQP